jgi:tRNA pseudouridine55 synthase
MDGIYNINKPEGWTSQDVCSKLRHRLHIKKIGHTGTLDPMATGVLPVCVGNATRIIEYYDKDKKEYRATMKLGVTTDTLDITGEILETHSYADLNENTVREAFKAYLGIVSQTPPKYSALKVNGKRAYDLARAGADFQMKSRETEIYSNEIIRLDLESGEIEFDVCCKKGTYIRTICDDIGRQLGCGAVMTALTRTASGVFKIEEAIDVETLCEMSDEEIYNRLIPMDSTLKELGMLELNDNRVTAFCNGNSTYLNNCRIIERSGFDNIYRIYSNGRFLGIGSIGEEEMTPVKVLYHL